MRQWKVAIALKLRNMKTETNIKTTDNEDSIRALSKGSKLQLASFSFTKVL